MSTADAEFDVAMGRFLEAVNRDRWWSTAELAVHLVASGMWTVAGLGDPDQQHIVARNGPRHFGVEVDDADWTEVVDDVLGRFAPDWTSHDPDMLKLLVRMSLGSDRSTAHYIYKRLGYLSRTEVEALRNVHDMRMVFDAQHRDEMHATEELMQTLGAATAGDVLPDTGRVELVIELPSSDDDGG